MRRCLIRYLAIVGLLVLVFDCAALIACIGIYRTDWYVHHSGYYYDSLVERRFELADPVDVLIVGDSSALLGAIPRVIESETAGLKVFNASLFGWSGSRSIRALLDRYLARNPAPRLVVLHIAGMNPVFEHDREFVGSYERMFPVLRYGTLGDIFDLVITDPRYLSIAAGHLIKYIQIAHLVSTEFYRETSEALAQQKGWIPNRAGPLRDDCQLNSEKDLPGVGYIDTLGEYLRSRGVRMAIYVAPMAGCDVAFDYYLARYRGIADNQLHRLPSRFFGDEIHLTPDGADVHSRDLGRFIHSLVGTSPQPSETTAGVWRTSFEAVVVTDRAGTSEAK